MSLSPDLTGGIFFYFCDFAATLPPICLKRPVYGHNRVVAVWQQNPQNNIFHAKRTILMHIVTHLFLLNIYNSLQKLGTLLYKVLDNFISLQPKS